MSRPALLTFDIVGTRAFGDEAAAARPMALVLERRWRRLPCIWSGMMTFAQSRPGLPSALSMSIMLSYRSPKVCFMPDFGVCLRFSMLLFWVPFVAACQQQVGRDLVRLDEPLLVPGQTSEAQIVALEGEPTQWVVVDPGVDPPQDPSPFGIAPVHGVLSLLNYDFVDNPMLGPVRIKVANFRFFNHRLDGWGFNSDMKGVSTEFDVAGARTITKGMSQDQVLARLGRPAGKAFYPHIRSPRNSLWEYSYEHLTSGRSDIREFSVLFGPDREVLETRIDSSQQPR